MKNYLYSILSAIICFGFISFARAQDINLSGYTQTFDEEFNSLSVSATSPKGSATWFGYPPYGASGSYSNSIWDTSAFSVSSNTLSDKAWIVTGQDTAGAYSGGPVSMLDGSGTAVVTAVTTGTGVNSHSHFQWDGYVGMKFTTSASGLVVSKLGRYVYSGNTKTHDLKLVDAATGTDVPNSVVTVATSGATAGTFVYASLPSNITLQPSHSYYLLSHEGNGGTADYWYSGTSTTVTTTSEITVNGSEWGEWHSGNLSSMDSTATGFAQQYGYFETKCQMPSSGTGAWAAFWLFTDSNIQNNNNGNNDLPTEEIDIFEWYGNTFTSNTSEVEEHNHNWNPTGGPAELKTNAVSLPGDALPWQGYHIYGCQVDPLYITWYIDGVQANQIATPPGYITTPNYMMFDYAVGGGWPSTGMVNPSTFSANWVRVYSLPTWPIMYNAEAAGTEYTAFSYQLQTVNSATSYTATGLPAGLTLNTATGAITGTPTESGSFTVPVTATNANGTSSATLTVDISSGLGIGIQFQGGGTALPSTTLAGQAAVTQVNWNVLTGSSFSSDVLHDNTGTTTTATLSGTAVGTYTGGKTSAPPAGNATLTSGELVNGSTAGSHSITVSSIPYANYDVYIYDDMDASGRKETVSLTPSGGSAQYYSFTTESGATTLTAATSTWNGSGTAPTLPAANYVHYTGLTASSFSTTWFAPSNGSINAIQIVPTSSLPSPWLNADIGAVGVYGSSSYASGVFTLNGSGADIDATTADSFQYAYQPVSGDCTITARVASEQNVSGSSGLGKAGVTIRETLATGATSFTTLVEPASSVKILARKTTGSSGAQVGSAESHVAPYWVRVQRSGNTFTGYASPDGTTWTTLGSTTITMATNCYIGLEQCSYVNTKLGTSTFDNVSVTTP